MYPPRLLEEERLFPFESLRLGGAYGLVPLVLLSDEMQWVEPLKSRLLAFMVVSVVLETGVRLNLQIPSKHGEALIFLEV